MCPLAYVRLGQAAKGRPLVQGAASRSIQSVGLVAQAAFAMRSATASGCDT